MQLPSDNLRAHKVAGIKEAIDAVGAKLRSLPKYSPDLNPIEMSFSKLKAYLRNAAERTVRSLRRRIGSFLPRLSAEECAHYFAHAGFHMSGIRLSGASLDEDDGDAPSTTET